MASIAVMAGSAIVNALAFSGSNFLFGQMSDHGKAEMKRHNLAMEQLTKAREEYNEQRQQRLDYINKTLQQQHHAEQTFNNLDIAMQQYYELTKQQLPPLKEPKLSDFYVPSEQQKDAEILFIVGGIGLIGYLSYKFL